MRRAPVFEHKNALPGSELHFSILNRDGLTGARQNHSDVRWHVVAAFGTVREVIGIFRDEPLEKLFQIAARSGIGIFHDDYAATGVVSKNSDCTASHVGPIELCLQLIGDFVEPLTARANLKSIMMKAHNFKPKIPCGRVVVAATARK